MTTGPAAHRAVAEAMLRLLDGGRRGALATVVRAAGSTPQQPGARLLLLDDGSTVGTVGGGAIEAAVLDALRECVQGGKARVLARDLGRDLGMCCGGTMEVFVEPVEAAPRLTIFGAGHVARPTAAMAATAGFSVTVVDDREELVTAERFPACQLWHRDPVEHLRQTPPADGDWLLIVTHDHQLDEATLREALAGPHRYVGLIGSVRKVFRILQRVHARDGAVDFSRLYAPVGLDLGALTPEEIAVSIVSELVALRRGAGSQEGRRHLRAIDDPRLVRVLRGDLTPEAASREAPDRRLRAVT